MSYDQEIDTTGLKCPLPVLRARKRLKSMSKGELLCMIADDPASQIDVPHFCAEQNLRLVSSEEPSENVFQFVIEAG